MAKNITPKDLIIGKSLLLSPIAIVSSGLIPNISANFNIPVPLSVEMLLNSI